jgi:hypothetical protein
MKNKRNLKVNKLVLLVKMDYRHFFNSNTDSYSNINNMNNMQNTQNVISNMRGTNTISNIAQQTIEAIVSQKYFDNIRNIRNIRNIGVINNMYKTSFTTSHTLWTTMISLSIPALCFAGYKIWKWIDDISKPEEELYEYKYLDDLDKMLECKLDDMKNPDIADVDTIKIDKKIFSLELFRSFKKNYRKKLLRQSEKTPIIKCVPIPAEQFNWSGSFTEDVLPNEKTIFMRYEPDTESFWWYCDSSTIPYKYLETVARKYVCEHNRLDVFIDIRDELKKGAENLKKRESIENGDGDGDKDGDGQSGDRKKSENEKKIYAKFRRYNKKNARIDASVSGKRMIIKARANRYSYKGKIEEYNLLTSKNRNSLNLYQSESQGDCDCEGEGQTQNSPIKNSDGYDHDTVKVENISWNDWKNDTHSEWKN